MLAQLLLPFCMCGADPSTCTNCHRKQTLHYANTPMARSLLRADPSRPAPLTFTEGAYRYTLDQTTYSVTDGQTTLSVPLLWSFGAGVAGQTYVYEWDGALHESRVSYYPQIKGLDLTLGAIGSKPDSLPTALGRRMQSQDMTDCFGCHSTWTGRFALDRIQPGVQCGACHGDVAKHHSEAPAKPPKTLKTLSTEELSELCGRCHRTWEQITIGGPKGISNVRFQPYRLTNSRCYDAEDRRISCVACHDPHTMLETRAEAYDARCVACHTKGSDSRGASRTCHTGRNRCSECHMPKYEIPGSHMIFSDHQIRIVRNKEDYPN